MVDALVARIRANHEPTRQWEPEVLPEGNVAQPTGRTALAALALLEAGVPAQSPKLLAAEVMLRPPPRLPVVCVEPTPCGGAAQSPTRPDFLTQMEGECAQDACPVPCGEGGEACASHNTCQ